MPNQNRPALVSYQRSGGVYPRLELGKSAVEGDNQLLGGDKPRHYISNRPFDQ